METESLPYFPPLPSVYVCLNLGYFDGERLCRCLVGTCAGTVEGSWEGTLAGAWATGAWVDVSVYASE